MRPLDAPPQQAMPGLAGELPATPSPPLRAEMKPHSKYVVFTVPAGASRMTP
ncbi:MAG: hypothetical protein R2702_03610 [Acidimicrobiales bacterium]